MYFDSCSVPSVGALKKTFQNIHRQKQIPVWNSCYKRTEQCLSTQGMEPLICAKTLTCGNIPVTDFYSTVERVIFNSKTEYNPTPPTTYRYCNYTTLYKLSQQAV